MKKIALLVLVLLVVSVNNGFSQVIKLEHGLNFTWMKGEDLYEKRPTYSVMLGCDYFEHDWFYLSSEIGYVKRGEKILYMITLYCKKVNGLVMDMQDVQQD